MIAIADKQAFSALDVAIWERDQQLGICSVDGHGQLVARAIHPAQQDDLEELLHIEYIVQQKHARQANRAYDAATFIADLPHIFGDYYTAQPLQSTPTRIPARFAFQRFDPATIPAMPRGKRS
jgi:hypothetical protein